MNEKRYMCNSLIEKNFCHHINVQNIHIIIEMSVYDNASN